MIAGYWCDRCGKKVSADKIEIVQLRTITRDLCLECWSEFWNAVKDRAPHKEDEVTK